MGVKLRVRRVVYEEGEFEIGEVMSLTDAAEYIGITLQTLITTVDRGRMTELVDMDAVHAFKNRRFVLRSEVEEMRVRRHRLAEKWGEKAVD